MLMNFFDELGAFLCENSESVMIVAVLFLIVGMVAQLIVSMSIEQDLEEYMDRLEALEKAFKNTENDEAEKEENS
jgi:hypothetical protein